MTDTATAASIRKTSSAAGSAIAIPIAATGNSHDAGNGGNGGRRPQVLRNGAREIAHEATQRTKARPSAEANDACTPADRKDQDAHGNERDHLHSPSLQGRCAVSEAFPDIRP